MCAPCSEVCGAANAGRWIATVPGRRDRGEKTAKLGAIPWRRARVRSLEPRAIATTDGPTERAGVSPSPAAREVSCDAVVGEQDSDVCSAQTGEGENQITVRVTAATAFLPHATAVCLQASGTLAIRAAIGVE